MLYRFALKNAPEKAILLSEEGFNFLTQSAYFQHIELLKNLRIHSNGYAFYQKNHPVPNAPGSYKSETMYIHKLIACQFITKPEQQEKSVYVMFKNGNRLDCRLENLTWATRSLITRNTKKNSSKLGYRGVYQDGKNFRATIYYQNERIELGFFVSADLAAQAYNLKSEELFGKTRSLNRFKDRVEEKTV